MRTEQEFINVSLGDAALSFEALAESVFREILPIVHRYYVSDVRRQDITTLRETIRRVLPYFHRRHLLSGTAEFQPDSDRRALVLGGGTTEGFGYACRLMMFDILQENLRRIDPIDPVLLVPIPTYGYFLQLAESWGLSRAPIRRDITLERGVSAEEIRKAFLELEEQGKRIVAYYDCNPHNPLGSIRGRTETTEIAAVLEEINAVYGRRDIECARLKGDTDAAPWAGLGARITVIDDMVYDGLEFAGEEAAFSFAQLDCVREDVILLFGLSKVGLAGLRAGVMIANSGLIERCYDLQVIGSYFPNLPAIRGVEAYFCDDEPFASSRARHLKALVGRHEFGGKLMKALIDGLGSVSPLSTDDKEEMIRVTGTTLRISAEAALQRLEQGIDGIRVATRPKAGFFHLLDFSGVKGRFYRTRSGEVIGPINDEATLGRVFASESLCLCFGIWTGLGQEDMLERVSFAVDPSTIVAFAQRLDGMLARFFEHPA